MVDVLALRVSLKDIQVRNLDRHQVDKLTLTNSVSTGKAPDLHSKRAQEPRADSDIRNE